MSKPTGGGANDVIRFLSSGAGPGSPTSNSAFSAASQADWAAKKLVWVPSEKHGFEVRETDVFGLTQNTVDAKPLNKWGY